MLRLSLFISLASSVAAAATPLPSCIVVDQQAETPTNLFAATELQSLLKLACPDASPLPIVDRSKACAAPFVVGPIAAQDPNLGGIPASTIASLGNESFVYSITSTNKAVLTGGSAHLGGGARGTMYSVYHVLEKLGYRFFAADETKTPSACPTTLPSGPDRPVGPAFEYRDDNQWEVSSQGNEGVWQTRVGFNGVSSHENATDRGNYVKYATPPGFVHTSYKLLGIDPTKQRGVPADLYNKHPAWFWPQVNASANITIKNISAIYGQLCWSEPSLVAAVTDRVRALLRAQPDANIISVSQNDNFEYCKSPKEQAINAEEGSQMGALLRAVNQIAAAIAPEFPHVAIDTLAYQWSRPAPKKTSPLPNVIVRLCSIECDFAHDLSHPNNAPFQVDMANWAKISNRTYIWDYITNFGGYFIPFPNWYVLGDNIAFFHKHGVKGVFEEGTYGTPGGDLVELKDYVIARRLFNVSADSREDIAEFIAGYYGPTGGPFIKVYMDLLVGAIAETNYYMHENFAVTAAFLTPLVIVGAGQAFAQAAAALAVATPGASKFAARVARASMPTQFVVLMRWDEIYAFATARHVPWPFNQSKRDQFDIFKQLYVQTNVARLNEGGQDINWLEKQLFPSSYVE